MAISTAIDATAVARVLGIKTTFKDLRSGGLLNLPRHIAVVGQGATASTYSTTKQQVFSAAEVGSLYGYGSPVHLAAEQLLPVNGDGVGTIPVTIYPLDDDGSGVASVGDITPSGTVSEATSMTVRINGIDSEKFVLSVGDTVADIVTNMTTAINAILGMPVLATDATTKVTVTSKWKGLSANDISLEVVLGGTGSGITFAFTQPVGGLVNPTVDAALAQVGDVWVTDIVNCLNVSDTTALDAYSTFGEGRWGALTRKPVIVYSGSNETSSTTAIVIPDARKTDRTNSQLVAPGSVNLPLVIAARGVSRITPIANNNPPQDYGSQPMTGILAGADGDQWTYAQRDAAVKGGSSTIEVKDGVVNLADTITFYHPTGEAVPGYRFVVDIVKLQNALYNLNLIFATAEWDGAPLIPDDQPTVNPTAKKPRMAVAEIARLLDNLALNAIISAPATAKATLVAEIDSANPKRLNTAFTIQLSGNSNIISIDMNFGFYFGTSAIVA